jgi:hypothetical protein
MPQWIIACHKMQRISWPAGRLHIFKENSVM